MADNLNTPQENKKGLDDEFRGQLLSSTPRRCRWHKADRGDEASDDDDDVYLTPQTSFSRQLRINRTLDETSNVPDEKHVKEMKVQFASNAISVIMVLASGHQPDEKRLELAKNYLSCITDDFGQHPPNVQGILNHIMKMEKGDISGPVSVKTTLHVKFPAAQGSDPAAQGGDPTAQGGGPAAQGGDPTAQGGGPAPQGGGPAAQGGGPAAQGGGPAPQGGGPAPQGGGPVAQGGGPAAQGGGPAAQPGTPPGNTPQPV